MGFNFGAFAGGLASGIQAGQKMVLDQKRYNSEVKSAEEKLRLEGQKLQQEVLDKEQKAKDRIADGMVKAEEIMAKDLPIESKLSMFNNVSKAYGLGTAKTMISDPTSGEKFVVDIPQEHLPSVEGIQKDLDIYKNEGNFKLDNTGALYTRPNAESEFTPIGFKGTNAKAFTKEEKPKFEKSWDSSKNAYVMTRVDEGSIIKDKPTTYAPTEGDKEYSSYVSHQKNLGLPVLDRYEYKQESKGGKVDATYQTKFDNAYNKLKQDNPDMNEVDLRSLADESIRSTQSERVSNKIYNMAKAIKTKLKVNEIPEINITEARRDKTNATLLDNYFIEKAKDKFGQTWQDDVKSASQSVASADKVFDAGNVYAQDIIKGKSGVNVVNRLFDNSIGSYLNKNLTSEEKLNASKDLASIMNVVRNEQFGAVVPMAEQTNFNDAATNLAKSSPDIVRGTISMLKQQKETMQTSKDVLGTELFTVKFGDKIEKLDDKIGKLESTLKTNTKSQNVSDKKKSLSEIFK